MKLLLNALSKFILGMILLGVLLFVPAGTIEYPKAWLLFALLFIPMLVVGVVLYIKAPELLKKRLDHREKQSAQKGVVLASAFWFFAVFVVSGLDFRFSWSKMPLWVTVVSSVIFVLSYILYADVMRENSYLSRTVKVEKGQTVVDSGLYGIVRHPMYLATLLLFGAMPIILGSWYAAILYIFYPIAIVIRLLNEEKLLEEQLEGYSEYKKKVKYRLIPFVW